MNYLQQLPETETEITTFSTTNIPTQARINTSSTVKRLKSIFGIAAIGFEFGIIYGSFLLSFYLRFNWFNYDNATLRPAEFEHYLVLGFIYCTITTGLLVLTKIYVTFYNSNYIMLVLSSAGVVLTSIALVTLIQLLDNQSVIFFSRLVFIFLALLTWLALVAKISLIAGLNYLVRVEHTHSKRFVSTIINLNQEKLIEVKRVPSKKALFIKRALDIFGASFFLLLGALPIILVAIAVKLDSKGSVIFKQTRVGKNGKHFSFYKFRSMYVDADERLAALSEFNETKGATFKMKNDPRVTRIGRILRITSLDEIPQLVNVLLGQMSLVGPRPGLPREVDKYLDWQHHRLEAVPGLTGLWQVSGRSSIEFEHMTTLDIYYINHWTLWLDIKILFRTIITVLTAKGAF